MSGTDGSDVGSVLPCAVCGGNILALKRTTCCLSSIWLRIFFVSRKFITTGNMSLYFSRGLKQMEGVVLARLFWTNYSFSVGVWEFVDLSCCPQEKCQQSGLDQILVSKFCRLVLCLFSR